MVSAVVKLQRPKVSQYRVARRKIGALITINIPADLYNRKTMGEVNAMKKAVEKQLLSAGFTDKLREAVESQIKSGEYLVDVFVDPTANVTINRRR